VRLPHAALHQPAAAQPLLVRVRVRFRVRFRVRVKP